MVVDGGVVDSGRVRRRRCAVDAVNDAVVDGERLTSAVEEELGILTVGHRLKRKKTPCDRL